MDVFKDKSWVKLRRLDKNYKEALNAFLDYAFATSSVDGKIACPCAICANRKYYDKETVRGHMLMKAMDADYQKCVWVFHGESIMNDDDNEDGEDDMLNEGEFDARNDETFEHDMREMIGDAFENQQHDAYSSGPNEEAGAFYKLIEDAGQPLHPGCEEFSKLSFVTEVYHLKCSYGVTDRAFNAFVEKRSQIGSENRGKHQICHRSGTKTHARVRAEEEAKGNKMDSIQTWLKTHEPKEGSKLDDASAVAKDLIVKELATLDSPEVGSFARDEVYKKVVGDDWYSYAKTFGLGAVVPRSRSKRCVLKEEKAKRLRVEEEHKETKVKLSKIEERVDKLEKMMTLICKQRGLSVDFSNIFNVEMDECDEDEDYEDVADDVGGNGVVGGEDEC